MFTQQFNDFVCAGDFIECEIEGLTMRATLEHDPAATPRDYDFPGACFDTLDSEYGEENQEVIDSWLNDGWHYFGLVISVEKNGIPVAAHVASLWGIEGNFPMGYNSYFLEVANELLPEAKDQAMDILKDIREKLEA
jgi:hypothetical protein